MNIQESLKIVWNNIYLVEDNLALFETIGINSINLRDDNDHFWFRIQKCAIDIAVLTICKLFDDSNKSYEKYTIPDLINNFGKEILKKSKLYDDKHITIFKNDKNMDHVISNWKDACPDLKLPSLHKLLKYRNKILAHQEKVKPEESDVMRKLPSINEMLQLVNMAKNLCEFINNFLFPDEPLPEYIPYAGSTTKNVIDIYLKNKQI